MERQVLCEIDLVYYETIIVVWVQWVNMFVFSRLSFYGLKATQLSIFLILKEVGHLKKEIKASIKGFLGSF